MTKILNWINVHFYCPKQVTCKSYSRNVLLYIYFLNFNGLPFEEMFCIVLWHLKYEALTGKQMLVSIKVCLMDTIVTVMKLRFLTTRITH